MSVDALRLDNQLCFPLYACAREVVRRYKPFLDALDLTYTQYVTMLVLWECPRLTSKEIGDRLHLDSGTLTPVLKRLDEKGLVTRARDMMDERNLVVALTDRGRALRDEAADIPARLGACLPLTGEEAEALRGLLRKLLDGMEA
ncbi:MAG: MarR family transcriptional regulator [Clostridia bacterium]|nr:MarR family transcriptional regulator [Clostridia bacterium]MBR6889500.1 MarR family transcriptional regulator [Clostridia bacterium]